MASGDFKGATEEARVALDMIVKGDAEAYRPFRINAAHTRPGCGPKGIRTPDLLAASQTGLYGVPTWGSAAHPRAKRLCYSLNLDTGAVLARSPIHVLSGV